MKNSFLIALILFVAIFSLQAQVPPQPQIKLEVLQKNLSLVEKVKPAPEKVKPGLESITAKDSIAMLRFFASDLMDGRETGTRGIELAAGYAASLFALWGVKPAGDLPADTSGGRGAAVAFTGRARAKTQRPSRKDLFQEFALKEISDITVQMNLEVRKGDSGQDQEASSRAMIS